MLFRSDRLIAAGAPPEKIRVHRMGVDLTELAFVPKPSERPLREILHVGRLVEKKGTATLLRAFARLLAERPERGFRLTIIGTGPLQDELDAEVARLGIGEAVSWLGGQPHEAVLRQLRQSDMFVLPSVTAADGDMEGVPVALMEAMATGVPVVSTRHSGIPELVRHEENGLLAAERDEVDLSAQMLRMADEPDQRRTMVLRARETVERRFDKRKLHDELLGLVNGLVRDNAAARSAVPALATGSA